MKQRRSVNIALIFSFSLLASCGNSITDEQYTQQQWQEMFINPTSSTANTNQNLFDIYISYVRPIYPREKSLKDRLKGKTVGGHQGGAISLAGNTLSQF